MPQRTATIESLPMAFALVKEMQADGLEWGEGYRPLGRQALAEIIQGRMAEAVDYWLDSLDGCAMRDRRNGSYPRHLLRRAGRHRAPRAPHPPLLPDRGAEELCKTRARDRPRHPGRLRARPQYPQGGRGSAAPARPPGLGRDRKPHRQDPGCGGGSLPCTPPRQPLQGARARWRGAGTQDRCRCAEAPGSGGARDQARRQEGDHRLPPGGQRERRRMGALPRPTSGAGGSPQMASR